MQFLKKTLRKEYKLLRNNISSRDEKENIIYEKLISHELFENADFIFMYASHSGEVSTKKIALYAEEKGKKTAFPFCTDDKGSMEFYFSKYSELKDGMYGIKEPDSALCEKAYSTEKSVCIVPGIAFGKNGERLGYGKGYYDRFLETFKGKTVALSFEECLSNDIPMESHDKKINYLFTDKKIYKSE